MLDCILSPATATPPTLPAMPCCPLCGARMTYQCAHVGGRGFCWRHVCPAAVYGALDGAGCQYIERWQS